MFRFVYIICPILILTALGQVCAESLWAPTAASMFEDQRARRIGDLLTIVIVEGESSSVQQSSTFDKSMDHSNAAGVGPVLRAVIPALAFNSSQKGAANGTNTISTSLATKLTATVTGVEPNGNLEVKAERVVTTNGEKRDITLTGVVRPQDVGTDNTVLSTYMAKVQIDYKGKGPIADRQKEGLISKVLRFLF